MYRLFFKVEVRCDWPWDERWYGQPLNVTNESTSAVRWTSLASFIRRPMDTKLMAWQQPMDINWTYLYCVGCTITLSW